MKIQYDEKLATVSNLLQSKLITEGILRDEDFEQPTGVVATAKRICRELEELEAQHKKKQIPAALADLQGACIVNNQAAIVKYNQLHYPDGRSPLAPLVESLAFILTTIKYSASLGRTPTMISAHKRKTMEKMRYPFLQECYEQLLICEDSQHPLDEEDLKFIYKEHTLLLVIMLTVGIPAGRFPSYEVTIVKEQGKAFFEKVWTYLKDICSIYPIGYLPTGHYDRDFYALCNDLINQKKDIFTARFIKGLFNKLSTDYPDPQIRLMQLFKLFENTLTTEITLVADQIPFKNRLKEIALNYGIDELSVDNLVLNTSQRRMLRVTSMHDFFARPPSNSNHLVPLLGAEKAMAAFSDTVRAFCERLDPFVRGDDSKVGSLCSLVRKLSDRQLDVVQKSKIRTMEWLYTSLFEESADFFNILSRTLSVLPNMAAKFDFLFEVLLGKRQKEFTSYMLSLSMSCIFQDKFIDEIRKLLGENQAVEVVELYQGKLIEIPQQIFRISEALKSIRDAVVIQQNNPGRPTLQIQQANLMYARASYFQGISDVSRSLICDQKNDKILEDKLEQIRDTYYSSEAPEPEFESEFSSPLRKLRAQQADHLARGIDVNDDIMVALRVEIKPLQGKHDALRLQARARLDGEHPQLQARIIQAREDYHARRTREYVEQIGQDNGELLLTCTEWLAAWDTGDPNLMDTVKGFLMKLIPREHDEAEIDPLFQRERVNALFGNY